MSGLVVDQQVFSTTKSSNEMDQQDLRTGDQEIRIG